MHIGQRIGCGVALWLGIQFSACAQPLPPLNAEVHDWLWPDEPPLHLREWWPAGGPLQRQGSRPGAWHATLALPLDVREPVQLWFWPSRRGAERQPHELRVTLLDAPPPIAPGWVQPVPLMPTTEPVQGPRRSVPLVLRADSAGDTAVLLVELWSQSSRRPGTWRVQARRGQTAHALRAPWWSSGSVDIGPGAASSSAPPSPLVSARAQRVLEVSIPVRTDPDAPPTVWRAR